MQANRPGSVAELTELYRETILQHATHPIGFEQPIEATHESEQYNPLCGDRVRIRLEIDNGQIRSAAFQGEACAICTASASLLCGHMPGESVAGLRDTHRWLQQALDEGKAATNHDYLAPLLGVRQYPSRIRCAMLPWVAAVTALGGDADPD